MTKQDTNEGAINMEKLLNDSIDQVRSGNEFETFSKLEKMMQENDDPAVKAEIIKILETLKLISENIRQAKSSNPQDKPVATTNPTSPKPVERSVDAVIANIESLQKEVVASEEKLFAKETTKSYSETGEEIAHQKIVPGKPREQAVIIANEEDVRENSEKKAQVYNQFKELGFNVVVREEKDDASKKSAHFFAIAMPQTYDDHHDPLTMTKSQIRKALECLKEEREKPQLQHRTTAPAIFTETISSMPLVQAYSFHNEQKNMFLSNLLRGSADTDILKTLGGSSFTPTSCKAVFPPQEKGRP